MEFKVEHLFFDSATNWSLPFKAGLEGVESCPGRNYQPRHVIRHFDRLPVPLLSPVARALGSILSRAARQRKLRIAASGIDVLASRSEQPPPSERRHRLSVILPVFNERSTFSQLIEPLLEKTMSNVDIEVAIVESNSTDGTRDDVRKIERHPCVTVVYEEAPPGKGHAVRTSLAHATGDFVLIQDADLEYDLNDYEALLEALQSGHAAFALGVRRGMNGSTWKVRHFADRRSSAGDERRARILHGALQRRVRHPAARSVHDVQSVQAGLYLRLGVRVEPV